VRYQEEGPPQNSITPVIPSGKTPDKGKKKMPFFQFNKDIILINMG